MFLTVLIAAATSATTLSSGGTPILGSAVVAALVAALVALATFALTGRRQRLDRQRQVFAEANAACYEYREFAYIVRRRGTDESERVRISNDLSAVQARMNRHVAELRVEAPTVGAAYRDLVRQTRHIAGTAVSAGWNKPPATCDADVHVLDVDLSGIQPYEAAYLTAAADHLSLAPAGAFRAARRTRAWWHGRRSER